LKNRGGYQERFSLSGKNAIVTGAVGILGRHFCEGLAESGANVAVVDLDHDTCADFANELAEKYGIKSIGISCDITVEGSVAGMVKQVASDLGDIDVLHNNVGGKSTDFKKYFTAFEDYELDQWRESMAINLDGVFLVDKHVGKKMLMQKKTASIIHTASIYGVVAPDQRIYENSEYLGHAINTPAPYAVSKAGIIGLTKFLATYWASSGIRVNCISPGGAQSGQNQEFQDRYAARVPLNRMAYPDEMVNALLYLASDASSYVTGQNIVIDGGLSVW
jgi:NAD(P)-dependent dehydrogenase (short-subunit alcohol dehydrogenase family)|tara:strand:- start:243 stop:1073 length:831 start_codon:yes stop_codon:yes gene_type:complete